MLKKLRMTDNNEITQGLNEICLLQGDAPLNCCSVPGRAGGTGLATMLPFSVFPPHFLSDGHAPFLPPAPAARSSFLPATSPAPLHPAQPRGSRPVA